MTIPLGGTPDNMMSKLASLNVRGIQSDQSYINFLDAAQIWCGRNKVAVLAVQSHNLNPESDQHRKVEAKNRGFTAVIGYADKETRGVYWGGTMLLIRDDMAEHKSTEHEAGPLTMAVVEIGDLTLKIASVYAPAPPIQRVDFMNTLKQLDTTGWIMG